MRGRPRKPKTSDVAQFRLHIGDQFQFGPGTLIATSEKGAKEIDPGHQEYIVVGTAMTGGGPGHNDVYPDGWEVRAVPLGAPLDAIRAKMVRFYQSGAFSSDRMPPPVIVTARAAPETSETWAGSA